MVTLHLFSLHVCGLFVYGASHLLQCSFMEYKSYKVVYRRYASLYVIMGVDSEEVSGVSWEWTARR